MKFVFISCLMLTLTGCMVTPKGPTVGSMGTGSDSAYFNATRGRSDAQLTKAQADQYSRQRQQVAEEMELEHQKTQNTLDEVKGFTGILGNISNSVLPFVRGF